ncbi:MAG: hypothetical protein FWG68_12100 [Defluviitaleaceae bacterium]|nr:hypothetical protein [Defluviitaleaceae bacterium]
MKATFTHDKYNSRLVFEAEDFRLQFAVAPMVQKLNKVFHWNNGEIGYIFNDNIEEYEDLNELLKQMQMSWDFSKYELEVG